MTTVGILSDTHNTFDDKLRGFLTPCDELWHAGDFGSQELADRLAAFRRVRGVYGNIDGGTTRIVYPLWQSFECEGVRVLMTHIGGYPGHYERRALERIVAERPTIFISGHSHILKVIYDKKHDVLHINPGAAGVSGFHNVRTAIRLTITDGHIGEMEVGQWDKRQP
ncbi:phosphoesterase [Bacteroidia bacterium]|nr:phosphoesterase [Bacteroidia bacterium]